MGCVCLLPDAKRTQEPMIRVTATIEACLLQATPIYFREDDVCSRQHQSTLEKTMGIKGTLYGVCLLY
ncbi:hypothetical protein STEG23_028760, partial [Scotinomys teguina]